MHRAAALLALFALAFLVAPLQAATCDAWLDSCARSCTSVGCYYGCGDRYNQCSNWGCQMSSLDPDALLVLCLDIQMTEEPDDEPPPVQ